MSKVDEFWLFDYSLLFRDGRYKELFPKKEYSLTQNLNIVTRIIILSAILLLLTGIGTTIGYIVLLSLLLFVIIYYMNSIYKKESYTGIAEEELPKENSKLEVDPLEPGLLNEISPSDADPRETENIINEQKPHADLFLDADSLFEKKNMQRQFFSVAPSYDKGGREELLDFVYRSGKLRRDNPENYLDNTRRSSYFD